MTRVLCAGVVAVVLAGGSAAAHHSYSAYHMDLVIQIDGELESFAWVNPHSLLRIRTADAHYVVEWRAATSMPRTGIDKDWLKVGDRLIVTGNPRRDLAESGVVNLKTIQRPSDGWAWPSR
jgi:hypothetical protein